MPATLFKIAGTGYLSFFPYLLLLIPKKIIAFVQDIFQDFQPVQYH